MCIVYSCSDGFFLVVKERLVPAIDVDMVEEKKCL